MSKSKKKTGVSPLREAAENGEYSKIYNLVAVPQINLIDVMNLLALALRGLYHDTNHESLDCLSTMFMSLSDSMGGENASIRAIIKRTKQILVRLEELEKELEEDEFSRR